MTKITEIKLPEAVLNKTAVQILVEGLKFPVLKVNRP